MNTLYCGDNLKILREHIASESVDLVYLDTPIEIEYYRNGGILPYVLRQLIA